jgi:hypothetical protein
MNYSQDYSGDVGLQAHSTYQSSEIDHVNLATGNIYGSIPLVSYPQKGNLPPLTFTVNFNTSAWEIQVTCDPYGDDCVAYYLPQVDLASDSYSYSIETAVHSNINALNFHGNIAYDQLICGSPYWPYVSDTSCDILYERQWMSVTDETGANHQLLFDMNNPNWAHATDGSGFSYYGVGANNPWVSQSSPAGKVYLPTGNILSINSNATVKTVTDPYGNSISFGYFDNNQSPKYIDSVQRTIFEPPYSQTAPISRCSDLGDPNQPVTWADEWDAPGPNGGTMPFIFCYTTAYIQPDLFANGYRGPDCDAAIADENNNPNEQYGSSVRRERRCFLVGDSPTWEMVRSTQ